MKKIQLLLAVVLLISMTFLAGCTVSQEKTDNGLLGTTTTTTTVGPNGVQKTTKNCPFWNPNC